MYIVKKKAELDTVMLTKHNQYANNWAMELLGKLSIYFETVRLTYPY